jgi:hypothetical protein
MTKDFAASRNSSAFLDSAVDYLCKVIRQLVDKLLTHLEATDNLSVIQAMSYHFELRITSSSWYTFSNNAREHQEGLPTLMTLLCKLFMISRIYETSKRTLTMTCNHLKLIPTIGRGQWKPLMNGWQAAFGVTKIPPALRPLNSKIMEHVKQQANKNDRMNKRKKETEEIPLADHRSCQSPSWTRDNAPCQKNLRCRSPLPHCQLVGHTTLLRCAIVDATDSLCPLNIKKHGTPAAHKQEEE